MRRFIQRTTSASPQTYLALVVGLVLIILIVPPIVFLINTSLHQDIGLEQGPLSFANFKHIFSTQATGSLARNTLIYAVGSTALSMICGTALAWLVERTNTPLRNLVYIAAFVILGIPGIVNVIGWILLLGPNAGLINQVLGHLGIGHINIFSLPGMIFIEGLTWTPVVFLLMTAPFKFIDPSLEEAGVTSGATRFKVFWRITARLAWPSLLAALMLSLIRTLESFETPALIGIPGGVRVLTTEIYLQINSGFVAQYGSASAYAVSLILVVAVLLWRYNAQTKSAEKYATITGKAFRPGRVDLGAWRYVGSVVCVAVFVLTWLPMLVLFWASLQRFYHGMSRKDWSHLSWHNYSAVFHDGAIGRAVANTLIAGVITGAVVMVVAFLTAWISIRTNVRGRGVLDYVASLPLVIPGVVAGIAVLRTYIRLPLPIYGGLGIIVVAYAMHYVPYGMRYAHAGIIQTHKELEESAEIAGASLWARLRRIVMPLVAPSLIAGFVFTFLNSTGQLAVPLMLSGPKTNVISVSIFYLYQNGSLPELSALCVCVTVFITALAAVAYRFGRNQAI